MIYFKFLFGLMSGLNSSISDIIQSIILIWWEIWVWIDQLFWYVLKGFKGTRKNISVFSVLFNSLCSNSYKIVDTYGTFRKNVYLVYVEIFIVTTFLSVSRRSLSKILPLKLLRQLQRFVDFGTRFFRLPTLLRRFSLCVSVPKTIDT